MRYLLLQVCLFVTFFFKKKLIHKIIVILIISIGNKCPFCTEFLPYPLPSQIRLLLNKIAKQNGKKYNLILNNEKTDKNDIEFNN